MVNDILTENDTYVEKFVTEVIVNTAKLVPEFKLLFRVKTPPESDSKNNSLSFVFKSL